MTDTIEQIWHSYLEQVVPKNATESQVIETKRAFYAGVQAMLAIMTKIGDLPPGKGMEALQNIDKELTAFGESGGTL